MWHQARQEGLPDDTQFPFGQDIHDALVVNNGVSFTGEVVERTAGGDVIATTS